MKEDFEINEEEDPQKFDKYITAGKTAAEALNKACSMVKIGKNAFQLVEEVESWILKQGCGLSFPINISINNQAAHYSPHKDDELIFGEKDVVKVDVGTHFEGFIGDTARTVDLSNENGKLIEASEKALENALSVIKAGIGSHEISKEIEDTIKKFGFKPVENLGGHLLNQYELHAGYTIPNVQGSESWELEEGFAIAIEPFASTGKGYVREGHQTEIFSYEGHALTRNQIARKLMDYAEENYTSLPFAERWLSKEFTNNFQLKLALRELIKIGSFKAYPVLKDDTGSLISQAEKTIIVEKDSCKIIT